MLPGMASLKTASVHWASGHPRGRLWQNCAEGTTRIRRPCTVALSTASCAALGNSASPGCERHRGGVSSAATTHEIEI